MQPLYVKQSSSIQELVKQECRYSCFSAWLYFNSCRVLSDDNGGSSQHYLGSSGSNSKK